MIKLERNTKTRGDETSGYAVTMLKSFTVREFVAYLLRERDGEWGYVGINNGSSILGNPKCEYRWGYMDSDPLPDSVLDKNVLSLTADGGWSRMDYKLTIEQ